MRVIVMLLILLYTHATMLGDQTAVTLEGRRVILMEDGRWKYDYRAGQGEVMLRRVPWGCDPNRIKAIVPLEPLIDNEESIGFQDEIAGFNALFAYYLTNGVYTMSTIVFQEQHSDYNLYLSDFRAIEQLLISKYGKPADHGKRWQTDYGQDDPKFWGTAVAIGNLRVQSRWNFGKVSVFHTLEGENYNISHTIGYVHNDMKALRRMVKTEIDKGKL